MFSYYFFNEDITIKIIFENPSDGYYYFPYVKFLSSLDLNHSFNPDIEGLKTRGDFRKHIKSHEKLDSYQTESGGTAHPKTRMTRSEADKTIKGIESELESEHDSANCIPWGCC